MEFRYQKPIHFNDIDHVGIVYYPTYFHYYHVAFEEFFGATHGLPYPQWLNERKIGFPTVHVEGDFKAPLRYGDKPLVVVTIARIGTSSVDFHFRIRKDDTEVSEARVTKACVDLETMQPREIPEDLRKVFERYSDAIQ